MSKKTKIALLAGSFDPPTTGHVDIIKRAAGLFTELHVVVAQNGAKRYLLPLEERISLMESLCLKLKNVKVAATSLLITEYMKAEQIHVLVRSLRDAEDYAHEARMAVWNKDLYAKGETVFLPASPALAHISSTGVKEVIAFGGDFSSFVPPLVHEALTKKQKTGMLPLEFIQAKEVSDGCSESKNIQGPHPAAAGD